MMSQALVSTTVARSVHPWLQTIRVAYVPGPTSPLLAGVVDGLLRRFETLGHTVQTSVEGDTEVLLTTATFGQPVPWRQALLFSARRRFHLHQAPTVFTLIGVSPAQLETRLNELGRALAKEPVDPADFDFPGLTSRAHRVLIEQGRRGGPMLALVRLLQSQAMSIRIILVIGDDRPLAAYLFDLVGAHPRSDAADPEAFAEDLALRIVTAVSTSEVTEHEVLGTPIPRPVWDRLATPAEMISGGRQLGVRHFFTEMVRVDDLVYVPALGEAVASQYSEGCFATWEPALGALMATVTGSARPVDKGNIGEDDLAVIVGVREDGRGARVRHVEGKRNDPPSSEAVEMMDMDRALPSIELGPGWPTRGRVPVVRSKLHGHRGVSAYDPGRVEYVPMDLAYQFYPVSCGTEAQARGIKQAFSRSESLRNPADPRTVAFTILPGHGAVLTEKWVRGKAPFQVLWESMDAGHLEVANEIPQGTLAYLPDGSGRRVLSGAD